MNNEELERLEWLLLHEVREDNVAAELAAYEPAHVERERLRLRGNRRHVEIHTAKQRGDDEIKAVISRFRLTTAGFLRMKELDRKFGSKW